MTGGSRRLTTPDGVEIALHRLRAHRDGRPAVLLVHGAFTNHRFWLHSSDGASAGGMAHFLGAAGLDVWLADLRHHGESAREPRRGAWTFEDWVLNDTPPLVARVREETDGAPLAWVGHSAGGAAGLCWLARVAAAGPIRGIVTFGTPGPRRVGAGGPAPAAPTTGGARRAGRHHDGRVARAGPISGALAALRQRRRSGRDHRGMDGVERARPMARDGRLRLFCWP